MVKLLLCSISAIVLGTCVSSLALAADSLTELVDKQAQEENAQTKKQASAARTSYVRKPLQGVTPVIKNENTNYDGVLAEAIAVHNFVKLLNDQIKQANGFVLVVQEKELDKARLADFDACEVKWLSNYFSSPEALWSTLKKTAASKITEYNENTVAKAQALEGDTASMLAAVEKQEAKSAAAQEGVTVNASARGEMNKLSRDYKVDITGRSNVTFRAKTASEEAAETSGGMTGKDIFDGSVEWQVGYAVLNSFYPNQDAWAKRKTSTTASLPLWTDQKYLYNETVWKPKYKKIVRYCAEQEVALAQKEPNVSDAYKYDYYFYDKVEAAHSAFVAAATAQQCVLTASMKQPPESAPRPLPPVYEDIFVLDDVVYPQNPMNPDPSRVGNFLTGTLWEAYKANQYKNIASKGELNTYFKVSGSTVSPRKKVDEIKGNRISKYFELTGEADKTERTYQGYLEARDELENSLNEFAQKHNITLPENLNYLKATDVEKAKKAMLEGRDKLIKKAKDQMGDKVAKMASMTTAQLKEDKDLAFLNALEKDKDALVTLTRETSMSIDESLKNATANEKLKDLSLKYSVAAKEKTMAEKNHKVDEATCMNSTGGQIINLKTVKIE